MNSKTKLLWKLSFRALESLLSMGQFSKPVENLSKTASEYVDLRLDELKLRTVKGLSAALSRVLSMMLILFALTIVMLALAFGLVLLLGSAIGSYAGGAFIVAGVFALVTGVLFAVRKKLFVGGFISLFAKLFFDTAAENKEDVQ